MTYESSSAASDVSLAPFGLRIIRAMQPSAARGETAECMALHRVALATTDRSYVAEALARRKRPGGRKRSCRWNQPGV